MTDYNQMSFDELKTIVRQDRTNENAWRAFFDKLDQQPKQEPLPEFSNLGELEQAIQSNPELKAKFGV